MPPTFACSRPPGQPTSARWRYVEKALRELRRIQPAAIPPEEHALWDKQLQELEEYTAGLRHELLQAARRGSRRGMPRPVKAPSGR